MNDRIIIDPEIQHGKPVIKGTRVNMRLRKRFISRQMILESEDNYEIIEAYPEDKYLPSYLIYSEDKGIKFHILIAVDVSKDTIRIITAYRPDPKIWDNQLKIRREEP